MSLLPLRAGAQDTEDEVRKVKVPTLQVGNEAYIPHSKMHLGPFRFHPFLMEMFGTDSNVFLMEKDPQSVSPMMTEAGFRFDLAQSKQLMLVGYKYRSIGYGSSKVRDNTEHEAFLDGDFKLGSFFIKLKEDYGHLYDPTPIIYDIKARREENKGRAAIGFDLNKLYIEAASESRNYHFEGDAYDRASNKQSITSGEIGYNYSKKTSLRLRFDTGSVDYNYDIQNDYTFTSFFLGFRYNVAAKLQSYLYLGSTSQSVDVKNNAQTKEYSGMSAYGSLAYMFSKKTTLSATLVREIQYNAYVNYVEVLRLQMLARYRWTPKIMVSLRLIFETATPSEKIGLATSSTKTTFGLSGRYDITRWLSGGLDFEFATKSASLDGLSFSDNKIFAYLTMHF